LVTIGIGTVEDDRNSTQGRNTMKRSMSMTIGFAAMALGCLISSTAWAGVVDSPLPELVAGKKTHHVFTVPGFVETIALGTFFSCTSLEKTATIQVGVEAFGSSGGNAVNDPVASSLALAPGETRIFGSRAAAGISVDSVLATSAVQKGSARILATSKRLGCTAFVADTGNFPPTTSWQLTITKKKSQKGD
jgi:hypothetical protein